MATLTSHNQLGSIRQLFQCANATKKISNNLGWMIMTWEWVKSLWKEEYVQISRILRSLAIGNQLLLEQFNSSLRNVTPKRVIASKIQSNKKSSWGRSELIWIQSIQRLTSKFLIRNQPNITIKLSTLLWTLGQVFAWWI